jgi:hypothetical protein
MTMTTDRRTFLAATAASLASPKLAFAQQSGPVLRPEDFGARGDGVTNDSDAFTALSARINALGGGTLALAAGKTYVVGRQHRSDTEAFAPQPLLEFAGLVRPLTILGNGSRLLAASSLRFGSFDPVADRPIHRPMPNYHTENRAAPYTGMISVHGSRAPVTIRDVELDGNLARLRIGGRYGDTGWQVSGTGLVLRDNMAGETIENVLSHHHGQDGAIFDGDTNRVGRGRIVRLICRSNGRQGLSIVGGRGYDFENCEFSHTGRSVISSAPSAGVDIEAEGGKTVRDLSFSRCRFVDNAGPGMIADSGDSDGARFTDCTFVGSTAWSAWPMKPHFRFTGCTFVGAVVHPFPDKRDPARATRFIACRFTDDPALSPIGRVYGGGGKSGEAIVNMAESENVLFDRCKFDVTGKAILPWSWKAIYRDCTMSQRSTETAMTKGKYLGTTTIRGPVDLYGSMIEGTVLLNGVRVAPGPVGTDIARW